MFFFQRKINPIGSLYGIFTYIWLIFMVNVGKYTIHGCYGNIVRSLFGTRVLHRCVGWHFVTLHLGNYLDAHHSPWWGLWEDTSIQLQCLKGYIYIDSYPRCYPYIFGKGRFQKERIINMEKNIETLTSEFFFVFLKSCFWSMAYCNGVMTAFGKNEDGWSVRTLNLFQDIYHS